MKLYKYRSEMKSEWDNLVRISRNGTFLQLRDYMDYHADRFTDCSLLVTDDRDRVIGVFPAERCGDTVSSHGGLTHGGWILGASTATSATGMGEIMQLTIEELRRAGVKELIYKPVPHIYHRQPCEEDIYFLWRAGGVLKECNLSSVIDLADPLPASRSTITHINRGKREGLKARENSELNAYWELLSDRLQERYGAKPVHTIDEITLLARRFPDNIKLWTVENRDGKMLGGILLFLCGKVAKAQYIASSPAGRQVNALDFLVERLINCLTEQGYRYFDLGTSNEDHGLYLNEGLVTQKTRYGARGIAYQVFALGL